MSDDAKCPYIVTDGTTSWCRLAQATPAPDARPVAWLLWTTGDGHAQSACRTLADVERFIAESLFGHANVTDAIDAAEIAAHLRDFQRETEWSRDLWSIHFEDGGIHALRITAPLYTAPVAASSDAKPPDEAELRRVRELLDNVIAAMGGMVKLSSLTPALADAALDSYKRLRAAPVTPGEGT